MADRELTYRAVGRMAGVDHVRVYEICQMKRNTGFSTVYKIFTALDLPLDKDKQAWESQEAGEPSKRHGTRTTRKASSAPASSES